MKNFSMAEQPIATLCDIDDFCKEDASDCVIHLLRNQEHFLPQTAMSVCRSFMSTRMFAFFRQREISDGLFGYKYRVLLRRPFAANLGIASKFKSLSEPPILWNGFQAEMDRFLAIPGRRCAQYALKMANE